MPTPPSPRVRIGVALAAILLVQAALIAWFAWPATELAPHDLPVVVAGPAPLAEQLSGAHPGAFDVTVVDSPAAADQALRDRDAYAAFIAGPDGLSLHVASAASPTVAALLTQAGQQLGAASVVDVVPGPADDPRGAGFAAGFLPLILTSLVAGVLLFLLTDNRVTRVVGALGYAVLAGLIGGAVLTGMGVVDGYLDVVVAFGLVALAITGGVAGLGAALGRPGVALGALLVFLLGNPISAVGAAPELYPRPWGLIGQLLPPGAGGTLVRSAAFFDWAGSAAALWTLLIWSLAGLAGLAFGRKRFSH